MNRSFLHVPCENLVFGTALQMKFKVKAIMKKIPEFSFPPDPIFHVNFVSFSTRAKRNLK